jgi:hypothetical protein
MIKRNPCNMCLVQAACTIACLDKYHHAKTKLIILRKVQDNIGGFLVASGFLLYVLLNFLTPIDPVFIAIIVFFILLAICGMLMVVQVRYFIPQISCIETILSKIDGDWL